MGFTEFTDFIQCGADEVQYVMAQMKYSMLISNAKTIPFNGKRNVSSDCSLVPQIQFNTVHKQALFRKPKQIATSSLLIRQVLNNILLEIVKQKPRCQPSCPRRPLPYPPL